MSRNTNAPCLYSAAVLDRRSMNFFCHRFFATLFILLHISCLFLCIEIKVFSHQRRIQTTRKNKNKKKQAGNTVLTEDEANQSVAFHIQQQTPRFEFFVLLALFVLSLLFPNLGKMRIPERHLFDM